MVRNEMICAVPARSGSKRLPGKNLKPLAGRPMIAYSIDAAIETRLFDAVYVCTEDEAIADVARRHGAEVPALVPSDLCGDLDPSHAPCQWMAKHLARQGIDKTVLLCLQPTSPLRIADDIVNGVEAFVSREHDFLVSVTPVDPHYFHWAVVPSDDGHWEMYFGQEYLKERPLLPPAYRANGSIKIARLESLGRTGHFFGPNLGTVLTPEDRSIHVATQFDFDVCDFLLSRSGK